MASGSVTLLEAAKAGSDIKKRGMIETIIQESPEIELLSWTPIHGNAIKHTVEDTLPQVSFRRINETYTRSFGTDDEHFWGVAILGGELFIDNFLLKVTTDKGSEKAKQWTKFAKSNSMRFGYEFWNGTGANDGFKGVKQLIDEGFGQEQVHSATGAALTLDVIDEAEDLFRNQGKPDAWMLNRYLRRKITTLARTSISGTVLIDVGTDSLGRKVNMYDDVPLRITGDVMDGSGNVVAALDFNEDPGDGTSDTASMYAVKFGPDDITGLLGAGGSFDMVDFGETEAAPGHLGRLEWYPGIAIFNRYSVVRISGITEA
jgi:hypothetical protein